MDDNLDLENDPVAWAMYLKTHGIPSKMEPPAHTPDVAYAKLRDNAKRGFTTGEIEDTGNVRSHKLTQDAKQQILDLYADGLGISEISTMTKLHVAIVQSVIEEGDISNASLTEQMFKQLRKNQPAVTNTSLAADDDITALGRKLSRFMNGR